MDQNTMECLLAQMEAPMIASLEEKMDSNQEKMKA
jgi:hypothetical protein